MQVIIPARFQQEHDMLTAAWLDSEASFDEIVEQLGSAEYIAWHKERVARADRLYEQGEIEN